jgi:hypothetical protein
MKNIIKYFIYKLIEFIEKIEYKNINKEYSEIDKFVDILPVNIHIKTDYGFVPASELSITKPLQLYSLELENGDYLECADNHIVFTDGHLQKFVKDLTIDDYVICKDNVITGIKVKKVKKLKHKISMADLTVNTVHQSYFTNNILSHNTISSSIFILHFCLFNSDKNVMIVANKSNTVNEIISKIKSIYTHLPFFLKCGVLSWNQSSLTFENGCRIKTEKRTREPAVGFSIDLLYLDEFAKIPNNIIRPYYTSVVPTVSAIKNSKIIVTSTPDGFNLFWELLRDAEKDHDDIDWNQFNAMRVYWWQIEGRRDTKLYFVKNKLEKYGLNKEDVLDILKTKYNYEIKEDYEEGEKVYYHIKYDSDIENTEIDFIRTIRINENIPLVDICTVTNWKEQQTKLIGGEEAFKQEYDIQFLAGSKLLIDNVMLEKMKNAETNFEYVDFENISKKFHLPYTDLKFIKNRPDLFDIKKIKDYYLLYGIDLGEGLSQDYSVINIFRLIPKTIEEIEKHKHKFADIYDYFKIEQIGIFRNNIYSLNEVAHLFYLLAFEVVDPEKSKAVLEYNTYGGEFLAHLPNVFNQMNNFSNVIFMRFKHKKEDKSSKIGIKVTGGNAGKKLLVKEFQNTIKKNNMILHNSICINELSVFTKKETPSGDITYKSESGHDDTVMSEINLSNGLKNITYKNLVDSFIQFEISNDLRLLIEKYINDNHESTTNPNLDSFGSGYRKVYNNSNPMYQKPNIPRKNLFLNNNSSAVPFYKKNTFN